MAGKKYPNSGIPIRKTQELLPQVFQTASNNKFFSGVVDPITQPGSLERIVGYFGQRYGKTFRGDSVYLDSDETLRSRYQLEPGVNVKNDKNEITDFYDYLDLKNQLKFFNNNNERDDLISDQDHYSWNPPIDWDKFTNYREYFWAPLGPPSLDVAGQTQSIQSTYRVIQGVGSSWIFTPDGLTNNPTITLYRGQTYKFQVNSPNEGFVIKTNYDVGSLQFDPTKTYFPGDLAVVNGQLFKSLAENTPSDNSTIDVDSQDWELIDSNATGNSFEYNEGIENNGAEQGTITFEVPLDAPDLLYYQSANDPNRLGQFIIADADTNTFLDVEKDIIGKVNYTSSNGIEFTNGLVIEFTGQTVPEKYSKGSWLIEGVGDGITLTNFEDLIPPEISGTSPEVFFDNAGFDTQPFDDANNFPGQKDYVLIRRDSRDRNPWSRYNRWFHRSVLEQAYRTRGQDFAAPEELRAKRPIIEFKPNLKLFQHGITAKQTVDFVDDFTTDVLSTIEGSAGYSVDGERLFNGARLLVVNDTDPLTNNKIYRVEFITFNGNRQIHLAEDVDATSQQDDCVLVRRGDQYSNSMFFFDGANWQRAQRKDSVNQAPLFDLFDDAGNILGNTNVYPVSTFRGNSIFSYAQGNGPVDSELGFSISYLNIDNVGDIQFEWHLDRGTVTYGENIETFEIPINTTFYLLDGNLGNGWRQTDSKYLQPIVDFANIEQQTNTVTFQTVDWDNLSNDPDHEIRFYVNGKQISSNYERQQNSFIFERQFDSDDIVTVKVIGDVDPDLGYYELPIGLQNNPFNAALTTLTLGQATDHLKSAFEFDARLTGQLPGNTNVRDLNNYIQNATRFVKHSGIAPLSVLMLCDKQSNLVRAIQFAERSYTNFKNRFVKKAVEIDFNDSIPDFLDEIITDLGKTMSPASPFSDSDMIGSGAYTTIDITVDDPGITTFTLDENFDLDSLSRRAVYAYINDQQLLHGQDYVFDTDFGFITILTPLSEGDRIQIREYVNTSANYIPPTPTALGSYKRFKPKKYVDTTFTQPREVIQGHDGSLTTTYGDFRDDLILELEKRIYNNIKVNYDKDFFDIDQVVGGYYYKGDFSKEDLDSILAAEFLRWVTDSNIDYSNNVYLDSENSFTYTYSNLTDYTNTENLPGWWRGVYLYIYDTDEPHVHPWEMLGFSEMPEWWEEEYGPAPYTSGNLILWEDISRGYIRQGERQGFDSRYARSTILGHIPVDDAGNLLSPLDSGFAKNFALVNNRGSFLVGDVAPAEAAWRRSSELPFAYVIAMCLLKPFKFITTNLDRQTTERNLLGQLVDTNTKTFFKPSDIEIPSIDGIQTAGLINYVKDYLSDLGVGRESLENKIQNIDTNLSVRMSGFVDKAQQKFLLDSKSPSSTNESIFIPPENYDIIFNVSSPVETLIYSGVIFEKQDNGWSVRGYNNINPFFEYYDALSNQQDPVITVGGISEEFVTWAANQRYNNGTIVERNGTYYRATQTHTSGETFDSSLYAQLPKLPVTGGTQAFKRRRFNKRSVSRLTYGTTLTTIQDVVDFLLGYGEYLSDQGFVFDEYDFENQTPQDWTTSAKEFLFWTKNNWEIGSLLTVSPGAQKLKVRKPVGVAENLLDGFYPYNLLKSDGRTIDPKFINVERSFQSFEIGVENINDGIFFLQLNYVLKEHVTVFTDRTVFNDVIYDKSTGYRQGRIKSQGFRTVDWDGDYTSPGFLFDNVNIRDWQPFVDYNLGDIVRYKSYNWVSLRNQTGKEFFDDSNWSKLDSQPEKQLVPNFDYRINSFEDYFEVTSSGISENQKLLARHNIGYQPRQYLQNIAEDPVTQFRLYQGFIQEKGTRNALDKVFDKLSDNADEDSLELNEEWAIRSGFLGGIDQTQEYEIELRKDKFESDPQLVLIDGNTDNAADFYYRINADNFTIGNDKFVTDVIPVTAATHASRTAGYVRTDQTEFVVRTRQDLPALNIEDIVDGDHIWITFDGRDWTVLRFLLTPELSVTGIVADTNTITVEFNRYHNFQPDEYVGFKNITNFNGIYQIQSIGPKTVTILKAPDADDPEPDDSTQASVYRLEEARFVDYESMPEDAVAHLREGSKLFVDSDQNNKWSVLEKQKLYQSKNVSEDAISQPGRLGSVVKYIANKKQILASDPATASIPVYLDNRKSLDLKQIVQPVPGLSSFVERSFGESIAVSPDEKWLAVGSPKAGDVPSNYKGAFDPRGNYSSRDIVLHDGLLWTPKEEIEGDGSTIDVYNDRWQFAKNIPATFTGRRSSLASQGMIDIYEYKNDQWEHEFSFVSPRPTDLELFGSQISISKNNDEYTMFVSAPGANNSTGAVYVYKYVGNDWIHATDYSFAGAYDPGTVLPINQIKTGQDLLIETLGDTDWNEINGSTGIFYSVGDRIIAKIDGDQAGFISNGTVRTNPFYPVGSIVWFDGNLYQAQQNVFPASEANIKYPVESNAWTIASAGHLGPMLQLDTTQTFFDSTLNFGATDTEVLPLISEGEQFGHRIKSNTDGSVLAVSAPFADDQYFENYKGVWRSDYEYKENDVVKYQGSYHQLVNDLETSDSSIFSYGQEPVGLPWKNIGDSTATPTGKVFVFKKNDLGKYVLDQTISTSTILADDSQFIEISSGDEFGFDLDVDAAGSLLVVSSPKADINLQNQGSVYIFRNTGNTFSLAQDISSFERYPNEFFGSSISISSDTSKIAVGAKNSPYAPPVRFDNNSTVFDERTTEFFEEPGYAGSVYLFELKGSKYFLAEKIQEDLQANEGFGSSVDAEGNNIVVGSPHYRLEDGGRGKFRTFNKLVNAESLRTIAQQQAKTNIDLVKSTELYDNINSVKIQDLDVVDSAKGKILNIAESQIDFKTSYDPAVYSFSLELDAVVDPQTAWADRNVGKIWWDVSTAKWLDYEQGELSYRLGNWNRQVTGSRIDIYEWVESRLLPSQWSLLADTTEGLNLGVSGQPLYPEDNVYSVKTLFDPDTQQPTQTLYYYWVRNKTIVGDELTKNLSAASIRDLIENPQSVGSAFIGLSGPNSFILYNFDNVVNESTSLVNFEFYTSLQKQNPVHSEWQLLSEGVATSVPNKKLENKWIDSLVGYNSAGLKVPAENLPTKQKYGILYRPRQSMFVDRFKALEIVTDRVNTVLRQEPFADTISFENLNLVDTTPSPLLNLYDTEVDVFEDLQSIGTSRLKQAVLKPNLADGELETVEILDPGFGYKIAPIVEIEGNGENAEVEVTIDNQGRVNGVTVTRRGRNYTEITLKARRFAVLVKSDSNANGFWGIYSWDDQRQVFFRSLSQAFDTARYWSFADFWKEGYSAERSIVKEIQSVAQEPTVEVEIGDLLRIQEYGSGGWAVFEKVSDSESDFLNKYTLVGRERGTIQFDRSIFDTSLAGIGYDSASAYDGGFYDNNNSQEIRNILKAVKNDIFIGTYAQEYNKLFFATMRYVLVEQAYVDWLFKTSFLKATHRVGNLKQKINYENDSLESYEDYVNEVKPYRSSIREFVSKYKNTDESRTSTTDFDLPAYYNSTQGRVVPTQSTDPIVQEYPWRWWLDNNGFGVVNIEVTDPGSNYVAQPRVLIEGDGTGAEAIAYIANGRVRGVKILNQGQGYTKAPQIKLVGGTSTGDTVARAVAIIGDSKVRSMDLTIKFDRLSALGNYQKFTNSETFVGTGSSAVYSLKYPPSNSNENISVSINNQLALDSDYSITLFKQNVNGYNALKGQITFVEPPAVGDSIEITYTINQEIFDAVDRIDSFYSPGTGMKGKDLDQLMTGVDYGGVKIQGTTFDVTGGWDALPWFTDSWDSVESESDFYVVVDGSTNSIDLPFIPAQGQEINVYLQRQQNIPEPTIDNLQYSSEFNMPTTVRIDDPNFASDGDSSLVTNKNAVMPTFVGDGTSRTVEIGSYVSLNDGDTLIFRPADSDGSVTINDINVLDTRLSGGTLSSIDNAYITANGSTPEEISIDGDGYNTPENTPATEENVPGQVLDSLSITVYQNSISGTTPALTRKIVGDGSTRFFDIGQTILETKSVIVYVDKQQKTFETDYDLNLNSYTLEFFDPPATGSTIEIFSIGLGGLRIIDFKEYVGDGETSLFLTSANFDLTSSIFVTVNGIQTDVEFIDSTELTDQPDKTLVQFGNAPEFNDSIKIVALGAYSNLTSSESDIVTINQESSQHDGSTRSFEITDYANLQEGAENSSVLVEVNNRVLRGVDTVVKIYDGTNNEIVIGTDPEESAGSILNANLTVFKNNEQLEFITDYVFNGTTKTVIINEEALVEGDVIKIENDFRTDFRINENNLIISESVDLQHSDTIQITWFRQYPSQEFISDEYSGGQVKFELNFEPVSASFLYVYLNGERLTLDSEYYLSPDKRSVYLNSQTTESDIIKIFAFGNDVFSLPSAYEIHKDMLNVDRFFRYSKNDIVLQQDLNYYDTEIVVSNAELLYEPDTEKNRPGMIEIDGEKIEYFNKTGNTLSQLRRGALGSPIGESYSAGSKIVSQGISDIIPYSESQERIDFVSDGSSNLIGPLPFIPQKTDIKNWFRNTIPNNYYQCNDVEVFVGGRRLVKTPRQMFNAELGAYSPESDETVEADFSVSGEDTFIRLTAVPEAGTRITVIKKTGSSWYDRGESTATTGESLIDNNSVIAKFIQEKNTELPE